MVLGSITLIRMGNGITKKKGQISIDVTLEFQKDKVVETKMVTRNFNFLTIILKCFP